MRNTVDSIDRISELPPFIIHQIMSNLQGKEVAHTSVLSKKWYDLCKSFPILDFEDARSTFIKLRYPDIVAEIRLENYLTYVDASMLRFCELDLSMLKFKLNTYALNIPESSSFYDKWLRLAVEKDVKVLHFDIQAVQYTEYIVPELVYLAKSVTDLTLGGCTLKQPLHSMRLDSLKRLILSFVIINEEMLYRLASECKCLEELTMLYCVGIKCFHVSEAYKLRTIKVTVSSNELESFKIVAPNLQQLSLSSFFPQSRKIDICRCINVKTLELKGYNLTDHEFRHLFLKFPSLENLKLSSSHSETFTVASGLLKNLNISTCPDLKMVNIDTPNLVSFTYMDNAWPVSHKIKAPCQWNVFLKNRDESNTSWYLNIKEFIKQSSEIEDLTLEVTSEMISFSYDEFRSVSSSDPIPCKVGNLWMEINSPTTNYAAFLDGVLSVCCPKILNVIVMRESHIQFLEWLQETMMNREAIDCCNANEAWCWRHYLSNFNNLDSIKAPEEKRYNPGNAADLLASFEFKTSRFHLDWCYPEIKTLCCIEEPAAAVPDEHWLR